MWAGAITTFFIVQQWYEFNFDAMHGAVMTTGVLVMAVILWRFEPKPMPAGLIAPVLRFCGRQTVLIYVVHFLTFALIARIFTS
jgi:peptidoglycan/LPS O-acetylase OafA/YrhL